MATVREGRKGPYVAKWIAEKARQNGKFAVEVIDLKAENLPMMNEPNHPRFQKYMYEYTKSWSAKIASAEAFVFVTAEYDFNYPAPLRNALEYLYKEWNYKTAAIVSYGGVSAGTRAFISLKNDLSSLKMAALADAVHIPFFEQFIHDEQFVPNDVLEKSAEQVLNELARWCKGMKVIRENS